MRLDSILTTEQIRLKRRLKTALLFALLICVSESVYGSEQQTVSDSVTFSFYFRAGDDLLLRDYRENRPMLDQLDELIKGIQYADIASIRIIGSASPEGNSKINETLAWQRAKAVRGYVVWQFPKIEQSLIDLSIHSDVCAEWLRAVELDESVPRRDRVLEILHSSASIQTKWANIRLLVGNPADYMERMIFPRLRNAVSCIVVMNRKAISHQQTETSAKVVVVEPIIEDVATPTVEQTEMLSVEKEPEEQMLPISLAGDEYIRKSLFALKTNLLFDLASALNVEVEIPIGKRWSIAGEWIFPWWLWEKHQMCLQVLSGNIEGRYWFGNRDVKPNGKPRRQLTGWFAGVYMGGGLYDLEWETKGYQGEFFIAAGLSGGYAHTINKSGTLRMEYALGVGYMQTKYREYIPINGGEILSWQRDGRYSWLGPTRAKVSLVWMINYKNKKGGVK